MRLDKRLHDPILLKEDILYYCKGLIKLLTSHSKHVSKLIVVIYPQMKIRCPITYNQETMFIGKEIT